LAREDDTRRKPIIAIVGGSSMSYLFTQNGAETFGIMDKRDEKAAIRFADGLVFTGGGDIDPKHYDKGRVHPNVYGVNSTRDEREFRIVKAAMERGIPMFGVCRGLQMLNVAHGGTLHQDIDEFDSELHHFSGKHEVYLAEHSRIFTSLKKQLIKGTSLHHQSVDRVGEGLLPAAWAPDGIVEMLESAPGVWPYRDRLRQRR